MGKIVVRVDDRLIHGQTIVAWCPTLAIRKSLRSTTKAPKINAEIDHDNERTAAL